MAEHTHDHDHDHEHGPDCDCGCHDHDHHHDHGHDHHHDHGYTEAFELPIAQVSLEAHVHEQASTVSASFAVKEGQLLPFGTLVDAMGVIAEQVEAAGGIVGHIKAFGKTSDSFAHASVTAAGFDPTYEGDPSLAIGVGDDAQLVAIALFIDQDHLISIVKGMIQNPHGFCII